MRSIARRLAAFAALSAALAVPASAQSQDIVATAAGAGQFKTLAALLTEADLVKTLQGPGPFTVFAPTDEAFGKVPAATLTSLKGDKKQLSSVLTYHVVPGKVTAADLKKQADKDGYVTVKTVEGSEAKISVMGGTPMINNAHIVKTDILAKNGVIHVIDAVILPPAK